MASWSTPAEHWSFFQTQSPIVKNIRLADLIDLDAAQKMADSHYAATGIPIGVIDAFDNSVLVGAGWQEICVRFHRANPESRKLCEESDNYIKLHLHPDKPCHYKCLNGLWDIGMPIIVDKIHLATMFLGQFFYKDEIPDKDFFRAQAKKFRYPEEEYLAALDEVPVFSRDKVSTVLNYDLALVRFITELAENELRQQRASEKLKETEQRYTHVVEQAFDGIYLADPETGRILEANAAFRNLTGYGRKALETMNVSNLINEPSWSDNTLLASDTETIHEARLTCRDGSSRDVELSCSKISSSGKDVLCTIVRDITERKLAEETRKKLETRLRQAEKLESVGRLAGGIAHDFNNMLGVIMGQTELSMHKLEPNNPLLKDLQKIYRAAEHSAELTGQLLAFARKQVVKPKVISLWKTLENMLKMLQRLVGEGVELIFHGSETVWPIFIDPVQIDQVLVNLCINARDAMDGNGRISIELTNCQVDANQLEGHEDLSPGDYVRLSVSDTGRGMDSRVVSQVFEPFFTTKKLGKGTGLGLSTVHGIISQNNGFIHVYSEPGRGTTFNVYLPRSSGDIEENLMPATSEKIEGGTESILLVEDEASILETGESMLTSLGYTVHAVGSTQEAIRLVSSLRGDIDLLLTDVIMPEMSGPDLVREILKYQPECKVVYMSGYTANMIVHHGVVRRDVHFLQKPFTLRQLALQIRETLDKQE